MTSQLFTIISLMIGLFGATISVIFVVRTVGSQKIKDNNKLANDKIDELKKRKCDSSNISQAKQYCNKMNRCGTWFTACNLMTAAIFGIWIFATAFYVSCNGYCEQLGQSASDSLANPSVFGTILFGDTTIFVVALVDSVGIAIACVYLWRASANYKEVVKLHEIAMAEYKANLKRTGGQTTEGEDNSVTVKSY